MDYDDVVLGRRSIRGYKPDPVPRALIEEIIGLAVRAPSSMNTQPWNFTVLTGAALDAIRAAADTGQSVTVDLSPLESLSGTVFNNGMGP